MYVCVCNAISNKRITKAVADGHTSFEAVAAELGVANCCGRCEPLARQVIKEANKTARTFDLSLAMPA